MITRTVDIHEAQAQTIDLLGVVMAGDEVIVTQAEKPVMRLVPIRNGAKSVSRVSMPARAGSAMILMSP